jgi:hypothetical protein
MHVETEWAAGTGNIITILGSRFTNNTSGVAGGALLVNGQNLQLQDTLFERNTVRIVFSGSNHALFVVALCSLHKLFAVTPYSVLSAVLCGRPGLSQGLFL